MEGRAIARPNEKALRRKVDECPASMEGRAIARPNCGASGGTPDDRSASMEGRAIARPNFTLRRVYYALVSQLQWRAEQLPGQTTSSG